MNRTNFTFDKIIHTSRFRILSRRVVSMALAGVMCLGLLPMSSLAAGAVWPLQATVNVADPSVDPAVPDGSGEAPTVTIEVNGVIDQGRKLTGFVEVAIRVKPGELHLTQDGKIVSSKLDPNYDHSEVQPFSSLAVALEYSDKLTPWEWEKVDGDWNRLDETQTGNQTTAINASSAIGGGFSARKMVEIDPLHKSTRIAQAAISPKGTITGGGSEGGGTATAAEGDGETGDSGTTTPTATGGGCLYLMAEGFTAKDFNGEDTVLAVVRFKYDLDQDDNKNPWSTMFAKGLSNPAVTDWIDPTSPDCLIKLASAATVSAPADSIIGGVELRYDSGKSATRPQGNRFYYSTDTTSADAVEAYDPSKPTTDPAYKSKTSNCMEVALVDTTAATPSTTTVVPGKINYTLVNKLSYNFESGDSAVILYYDWDDRHIGTQVLSPGDAREDVNKFVEENFIYPDLRYSAHKSDTNASDYTDSLLRENTYRGEYPYDAPVAIPDVTSPTYDADLAAYQASIAGKVVTDGASYPLTNKLDYVFYKRYTQPGQTVTDPDGTPDSGDETTAPARTLVDPDGTPDSGDEYYHIDSYDARLLGGLTSADVEEPSLLELPYIYGWAVVDNLDGIADVWTTLGTAEHTPYSGMDGSQAPIDTTVDTTYNGTGDCLQFADFSNLQKGQVVRVKAVYEPGPELQDGGFYSIVEPARYERYGDSDTSAGGVYAIAFSYARANAAGKGVNRMRDPSARIDYTPDVESVAQKPFSIGVDVENRDTIAVTYTPSSALMSMEYSLRDRKLYDPSRLAQPTMVDYNFYTGSERAQQGNLNKIMENFNYEEHPYSQHLGSMGFVTVATLNQLDKVMREAVKTGVTADIIAYVNELMMNDLNLKTNDGSGNPINFESWDADEFRAKILDAYRIAGDAPLDWHQIQYHIWNTTYDWSDWWVAGCVTGSGLTKVGNAVQPAVSTLAYDWCRIDNCSGGSSAINTWADLMKAVADYVYTPNTNALNQLQDVFELRKGITGQPFADKDAMKAVLLPIIGDPTNAALGLRGKGFTQTDIEGLSWKQVQYLLDLVDDGTGISGVTPTTLPSDSDITPTGATGKDYWWENGGTKTITTWQELLEIQYHIINDNWFAGDGTTSGWRDGYNNSATALTGKVRDKDAGGVWKPTTDANPFTTKSVALRKNGTGDNFDNITQFNTALNAAITTLTGQAAYATGSFTGVSLMEIQHALLGQAYRSESDLMDDTVAGTINYWWITGTPEIKDLKGLVQLVEQVLDGAPDDLLDKVTVSLVSGKGFWLRADTAGTVFGGDAALRSALKTAVGTWRAQSGNSSATAPWPDGKDAPTPNNWTNDATRQVWSQLQNLLLGNSYDGDPDPGATHVPPVPYDYWWYNDGHKPITDLASLLEAAWNSWGGPGGTAPSDSSDPGAMDALKDETTDGVTPAEIAANLKFITGVLKTDGAYVATDLYFRKNDNGDAFDSVGDFKTQLKNFVQAAAVYGGKTFVLSNKDHWTVVQNYLINGTYRYDLYLGASDPSINYWWKDGEAKPTGPSADYTWADSVIQNLTRAASNGGSGGANVSDIEDLLTDATARALNIKTSSTGTPMNKQQLAQKIVDAVDDYYNNYYSMGDTGWDNDLYDWTNEELPLDWRSFQNYIVSGGDMDDLSNTSESIMDSTYGINWIPGADESAGADYTAADAYTSALSRIASATQGSAAVGDLTITEDEAKDLNIRAPGGSSACNAAQLEQYIVDAVNDYYNNYYSMGDTGWDNDLYDWGSDELPLDWKSLQNYIISGDMDDLSGTTYEDMKTNHSIDWYPVNDVTAPGTYSIQQAPMKASLKVPARKPVEESETTNVTESPDGSRKVTIKVKTTVDPNTGLTTVEEERTEERHYEDGRTETVTDITIIVKDTATGEEVSRETKLGTPVMTDAAEIGAPGTTENVGADVPVGPQETTDLTEPDDPDNTGSGGTTTTPTDPDNTENGDGAPGSSRPTGTTDPDDNTGTGSGGTTTTTDPTGTTTDPTETTDPTKDGVGADDPVGPQTPTDSDNTENGNGATGSSTGTTTTPTEKTDPTKDDVGADDPVGPQTTTDTENTGDPPLQGRLKTSLARRLYAGPPNRLLRLRPPITGLLGILNHHILTTGRTLS